jgi:hypothetical protein
VLLKPDIDHELSLFRFFCGSNLILGGVCALDGRIGGAFSLSGGKRRLRDGIRCLDCGPYASGEQSGSNDSVRNCGESRTSRPFKVAFVALLGLIAVGLICSVKGIYSDSGALVFSGTGIAAAAFSLTPLLIVHFPPLKTLPPPSALRASHYGRADRIVPIVIPEREFRNIERQIFAADLVIKFSTTLRLMSDQNPSIRPARPARPQRHRRRGVMDQFAFEIPRGPLG